VRSKPRRRVRRFAAGVARSNHDHVELLRHCLMLIANTLR
jgi:hypothetical protein